MAVTIDLLRAGTTASGRPGPHRRSIAARALSTLWVFAVVALFVAVGIAWAADWRLEVIRSGSMEPTVPRGSLAVVGPVHELEIDEGDVIAFRDPTYDRRRLMHRVVSVLDRRESGQGVYFSTRGDANATLDPLFIGRDDIVGRMRWHIPRMGDAMWMLRPPYGFVLFVGLPAVAFGIARRFRRRDPRTCPHCGAVRPTDRALRVVHASGR